jgi:hypothetical protein
MKKFSVSCIAVLAALSSTGCLQSTEEEGGSPEEGGSSVQAEQVIFPDDTFLPRQSCDLGAPLDCPSTVTYSVQHMVNLVTHEMRVANFFRPMSAVLNNRTISCRPADFVAIVKADSVVVPSGVTVSLLSDHSMVAFSKPIPDGRGAQTCGIDCTAGGPVPRGCAQTGLTSAHFRASVTASGSTRSVQMESTVDGNPVPDPVTRRLDVNCRVTLRGALMETNVRNRPDDVISTSGNRFVRGYDLRGTPLRSACSALANMSCMPSSGEQHLEGLGECIQSNTDRCVSTFSHADPCVSGPISVIR